MNKERLLAMADHLERGQLGTIQFNFALIQDGPKQPNGCGTVGCALGEMPILFPNAVTWLHSEAPDDFRMKSLEDDSASHFAFGVARSVFDLEDMYTEALFAPTDDDNKSFSIIKDFGGVELTDNSTKEQVASNIRKFVLWYEAGGRSRDPWDDYESYPEYDNDDEPSDE